MKNKTKIIVGAFVALIVILLLVFIFTKKDDTTPSIGNDVVTPTLSLEVTKIPHSILTSTPKVDEEIIPTAPIISDDKNDNEDKPNKDDAIDFPNDDVEPTKAPSLVTPRPNVTLAPTPTTKVEPTPTTKVEPTKAPTPSVAPTSTPKVEPTKAPISSGDDSGETIKLGAIGVEVPKRDSFNHEALENTKTSTWYGKVGDKEKGMELTNKLVEIRDTLIENHVIASGDQAFLYTDNVITFDYLMKGANSDLELHRDTTNGEYILEINSNLEYDYYKHYDIDFAPYSRDIVKSMLAIILDGDDVENVFSNIYTYLHEDASILSGKTYKEIGNCKVLVDKDASWVNPSNNSASFVFRIKPN